MQVQIQEMMKVELDLYRLPLMTFSCTAQGHKALGVDYGHLVPAIPCSIKHQVWQWTGSELATF
jgi:hypothetical protein